MGGRLGGGKGPGSRARWGVKRRWCGAGRTVAVGLDEEGLSSHLLPLLGQVHEAPAERGQRPGEAHGGEEGQQVGPEHLGSRAAVWVPRLRSAGGRGKRSQGLPQATLGAVWGGGPERSPPRSSRVPGPRGQRAAGGQVPGAGGQPSGRAQAQAAGQACTHVAHPVHGGADQVEGADADGPHAVRCVVLAVGTQLLRPGLGGAGRGRSTHGMVPLCSQSLHCIGLWAAGT